MSSPSSKKNANKPVARSRWHPRIGSKRWVAMALIGGALTTVLWMTDWKAGAVRNVVGQSQVPATVLEIKARPAALSGPGNQLGGAASPYLREAARQPVHWMPWTEAAFRRAQQEDKPILLDIGAVWCHWCHVMDVESYENDGIADIINSYFVPVKVDMDERPDIDHRYQQAVQALSGTGGWPLTAFLTPEGKVFFGGTYFPPDDRLGRPGFKTLLIKIAAVYKSQKTEVLASAEKISAGLKRFASESIQSGDFSEDLVDAAMKSMVQHLDSVNGGFGTGVKFPAGGAIELALALYFEKRDSQMLNVVTKTLDGMAHGGVYDHIGGGFFRYSTDPQWRVPHFEKMNYDNAELLVNYLHAYQATGRMLYKQMAEEIMGYLNAVLSDQANGGFYAHQDADMTREDDGDYYTWTVQEIRNALSKDEAEVILRYYDVQPRGEMKENPAKNVLFIAATPDAIAKELRFSVDRTKVLIDLGRKHLLAARFKRQAPLVDTTIYSDRNGLLISAYLEAYRVLSHNQAKAFALKTIDRLLNNAYRQGEGMFHAYFEGKARLPGLLTDQVRMAKALLEAFEVTGERRYLEVAKDLMNYAITHFWDSQDGGFFDRLAQGESLAVLDRPLKEVEDNPTPSPNGIAALVLDRLAYLTNDAHYEQKALQTLRAFAGSAKGYGHFGATYALAVHYHINRSAQAVIIGRNVDPTTQILWKSALTTYRPGKVVAVYDPTQLKIEGLPPAVAGAVKAFGVLAEPRAYVCVGSTCAPPTGDPAELVSLLKSYGLESTKPRQTTGSRS